MATAPPSSTRFLGIAAFLAMLPFGCTSDPASSNTPGSSGSAGAGSGGAAGTTNAGGAAGTTSHAGSSGSAGNSGSAGKSGCTLDSPEILFDGTELDLDKYNMRIDDPNGFVDIVDDPAGAAEKVLRFYEMKENGGYSHVMARPGDKRANYQEAAQLTEYEAAYHYRQRFYVSEDKQLSTAFINLVEDFHCEPCEANSLQLFTSYQVDDSVCLWVAYSTDANFDPRGLDRGSDFDPWPTISANKTTIPIQADGSPSVPANLPETGALLLCRDDLHVSQIQGRWIDLELYVKPSSHDSGRIKMWLDGKPYFYDGPNNYRWNQDETIGEKSFPINNFQFGLYMAAVSPDPGTPDHWELFTTPPFIEIGKDLLCSP
jgi:hypothetical protein